jgi:hypothetical protein
MNRNLPPFRNRDAETRRAVQASVARSKRLPAPAPPETVGAPGDATSSTAATAPAGPSEPQDQPVPWGWQSTGSDLPRARRRYDPAAYASWSANQVIVPPQVPPEQPRPVLSAGVQGDAAQTHMGGSAGTLAGVSSTGGVGSFSPVTGNAQPQAPEPVTRKRTAGRRAAARPRGTQRRQITITNRAEVIRYTTVLIIALEETLEYNPRRAHNQPPPALWNDDPEYLRDVGSLVIELRRLNSLLDAKRLRKKEADRVVIHLAQHFDQFLRSYVSWFGRGAAVLTIGVMAGLLQHAGLDPTAVCATIRLPH